MPWQDDSDWDDALEASDDIRVGGDDRRPGTEYLYRPDQLVCERAVWTDPTTDDERELGRRLREAGATEFSTRDVRAATAERLGLQLLELPADAVPDLMGGTRDLLPDALAFNHVMVANPQRYGGCAPPVALAQPTVQIPGSGGGGASQEGTSLKVAVLDTGVAADMPFGLDQTSDIESGTAGPASGHGTMVAGVISRYAPLATILAKQVLSLPLGVVDELQVAAALDELPDDVDVVNASFGGPAADRVRMLALLRALERLPEHVLVIASSGNEGVCQRHYMAAFDRVVGVASVEDGAVAQFANRGEWIKLSTQGTDVETLRGADEAVLATGTSFAAPKITAKVLEGVRAAGTARQAADNLIQTGGQPIPDGGTFVDIPGP